MRSRFGQFGVYEFNADDQVGCQHLHVDKVLLTQKIEAFKPTS